MLLSSATTRVELAILGYQFPAITDDDWDSNWLNIQIHAQDERGSWTATDPCLLTTDLTHLAEWFEATAGRQPRQRIDFIEPNLAFEVAAIGDDDVTVRVWFELECRPPWAPSNIVDEDGYWIDITTPNQVLANAASSLREQLAEYPVRAI